MKKINRTLLLAIAMGIFLSACGTKKVNIEEFAQTDKDKEISNHYLSKNIINKVKKNVIILPTINNTSITSPELSAHFESHLSTTLTEFGNLNIINNDQILKSLKNNLQSEDDFKGISQALRHNSKADYAVINIIRSAYTQLEYRPEEWLINSVGTPYIKKSFCESSGSVTISYKLLNLKTGHVEKIINSDGVGRKVVRGIRKSEDCKVEDPTARLADAIGKSLKKAKVQNYLAATFPTLGYVWQVSSNAKERVISVTLGAADHIKPGDELDVLRFSRSMNPVTQHEFISSSDVGKCTVLENNFAAEKSLCLMTDGASKVKIKHVVRKQSGATWIANVLNQ